MKMNKVKVLVKSPGQYTEVREIEPTYGLEVTDIVDDWLKVIPYTPQTDRGIIYYCSEEGKLRDLAPNIALDDEYGREFDVVVGDILVVKYDENDCITSLTKDEIAFHKNWLDVRGVENDNIV